MIVISGDAIGWIREVVLDGPDPLALGRFWAGLLGGTPVQWYPGWVTLEPPPHGQRLSFQATTTPGVRDVARVHFDILVEDLAPAPMSPQTAAYGQAGGDAAAFPQVSWSDQDPPGTPETGRPSSR